jgi:hypothetical protein
MNKPLVSLREAADDFNAGKCQLQTGVEVRVGHGVARWELVLDTELVVYDNYGRPMYSAVLYRTDIELGEGEPPPEALWGGGPRDVDVVAHAFGIDLDARVWTKGSKYAKD